MKTKTALITGGARRIGASIAEFLHRRDYQLIIHYRDSEAEALTLQNKLNSLRANSVEIIQGDLSNWQSSTALAEKILKLDRPIDTLINNASTFHATPLGSIDESHWQNIMGSNLQAPLILAQALADKLKERGGNIINISDIYGQRPLLNHSLYCTAKAGMRMLTQSLALELAPHVRVNGIAPGAILWPSHQSEYEQDHLNKIKDNVPLGTPGNPEDIAKTVWYLLEDAPYTTGMIISVDGGRSLNI